MTVPAQATLFNESVANGVTTSFPYQFMIASEADITVELDGVVTTIGFTVTGVGNANGGSIDFSVAPANGVKVLRYLDSKLSRTEEDYQQFGDFNADTVDLEFDRLWLAMQSLALKLGLCVRAPISSASGVLPEPAANNVIGWNEDGTGFKNFAPVDNTLLSAELSASSGSNLVGYGSGTVKDELDNLAGVNSTLAFFAKRVVVGDGVTDDTTAITALHAAANLVGALVSYAGVESIAIQANAQIPVKTSVDFCGVEVVILGGVVGSPSFSTFNTVFVVSDDDCPLQSTTGAVTSTNLVKGSIFPTLGLFDGHGYAKLSCALQVPDRAKTGTMNYTQAFKVNRDGRVSHPLSTDVSAHAAAITVSYRKTSKKRLFIRGLSVVEGTWNNQRILKIERANVEVEGFSALFETAGTFNNVCELISIADASDILIKDFITTGRPVTTSVGSYCLAIYGGADITVEGMNALSGWGAVGTDDVNGLRFIRSVVNRVDCHSSGHNIFVDGCDIHENGITYGWGGGIISAKNSRFYRCPVIQSRSDYGGSFFGSFVVDGVECSHNGTSTYTAVDLASNPLGASSAVYTPDAIEVSNLKRVGKASANNAELIPVAVKILDSSSVVYAPARVSVINVACGFPSWRFGMRLDSLNMEANPGSTQMRVVVCDVYPDTGANGSSSVLSTGILDYDSVRTPTTPVRPAFRVNDSDHIALSVRNSANVDIHVADCGINAIVVDTATATKPLVVLESCRLLTPAAGFTNAPIGAGTSGASGHTIVKDCEISGLFDLSNVAALQGCTIRTGANQPTLPSTVTASQAFSGWQKAGVFS